MEPLVTRNPNRHVSIGEPIRGRRFITPLQHVGIPAGHK